MKRPRAGKGPGGMPGRDAGPGPDVGRVVRRSGDLDPDARLRSMERLADLLPGAARQFGLEDQLEQAGAAAAWLEIVARKVPVAKGGCRLIGLSQGVATIEADEPIIAQEIRLRAPELLAALRKAIRTPLRQLRITMRHV